MNLKQNQYTSSAIYNETFQRKETHFKNQAVLCDVRFSPLECLAKKWQVYRVGKNCSFT